MPSWRLEIDRRVQAKTRIIHRAEKAPTSKANRLVVPNRNQLVYKSTSGRFAAVAEVFFYPLLMLYRSKRVESMELVGRDSFLLGRLLYTLAAVLNHATGAFFPPPFCTPSHQPSAAA